MEDSKQNGYLWNKKLTTYLISGVWVDMGNVTHYAIHKFYDPGVTAARKLTKEETICLIETPGKFAFTWEWNYQLACYETTQPVECCIGYNGKFLCTRPKEERTKNLKHLVNLNWLKDAVPSPV